MEELCKSKNTLLRLFVFLVTILLFNVNLFSDVKTDKYVKIRNDSIRTVSSAMYNFLMSPHNDEKVAFESITYKDYSNYSFRKLYDSLSSLYIPFKCLYVTGDLHDLIKNKGIFIILYFLIDSNTTYDLLVFIPDKTFTYGYLNRCNITKKLLKQLFKLKNFGIIAEKNSVQLKDLKEIYKEDPQYLDDSEFFQEYLKLLKKLPKK